jgi:ATP-binding cassette subfamily B multidrug efflux pump
MSEQRRDTKPPTGGPRPGGFGGGPFSALPPQKAKNFKGTLRRLIGYLRPHRINLLAVFITAIISTVFAIVSPKIMGNITTKIFEGIMTKGQPGGGIDFEYIIRIVLILIGLYPTISDGRSSTENGV